MLDVPPVPFERCENTLDCLNEPCLVIRCIGGFDTLVSEGDSIPHGRPARGWTHSPARSVVAILAVRLIEGGPAEWVAGVVIVAVAHRTDSFLLAMMAGVGVLLTVRRAPL